MHNWWIAALEEAGIWSREQAEHVANNIKNSIHKEKYPEAFVELKSILEDGKFNKLPMVSRLENDVSDLKSEVEKLKKGKK